MRPSRRARTAPAVRRSRSAWLTAVSADAQQTSLCALLSAVLVVGVGLNTLFGWWWADPVAALVIGGLALEAGRRVWRADSLADTCCG